MKKILAGIMAVALVAILAPAYATNSVTVDINPNNLQNKISWDFGNTVTDRDYCFSKTETWLDNWATPSSPVVYESLMHFNGTNYDAAEEGRSIHYKNADDIRDDAKISCKGSMNYKQKQLYTVEPYFSTATYMSFGEVYTNGTINWLNEAITYVSNMETQILHDNCDYDTFDHTTEVMVNSTMALRAVHDKSGSSCIATTEDLTDDSFYKKWFNNP